MTKQSKPTKTPKNPMQEIIDFYKDEKNSGKSHILIATQIDPDAIGGCLAVAEAIKHLSGSSPKIYYGGAIAHPQNNAMFNVYNLKERMQSLKVLAGLLEDEAYLDNCIVTFVDSCMVKDARLGKMNGKIEPDVVIDHHRGNDLESGIVWIEEVGSASTLATELLENIGLLKNELPKYVSVCLALGIYTDTSNLTQGCQRDRQAYGKLTELFPSSELTDLMDYKLPVSHYNNLHKALGSMDRRGSVILANIGHVPSNCSDDVSTIADFLGRMDGISFVVVFAILSGLVRVSVRNQEITIPLDEWMSERFGELGGSKMTPEGIGQGGANIPLDLFRQSEPLEKQLESINAKMVKLTFEESNE